MNVVILGNFSETAQKMILRQFPPEMKVTIGTMQEAEPELARAEVIIPEHVLIDGRFLDRTPKLRLVQTGAGFDNVVIPECTRRSIYVANAAGVNSAAVAEHVMAFILCWYKSMIHLDGMLKRGQYSFDYIGAEVAGKTLGIIGMGNIGQAVARKALAFDLEILGYSIRPVQVEGRIRMSDKETLLRLSDVITLHCSLNEQSRHMIGHREIASMKQSAFLINTARGAIVDEEALIEGLRSKKIAGAGLDVFEKEPLPTDSPLRTMENVILTPHTAGTPEGLRFHQKRYAFFVANILRVFQGQTPLNALNKIEYRQDRSNH